MMKLDSTGAECLELDLGLVGIGGVHESLVDRALVDLRRLVVAHAQADADRGCVALSVPAEVVILLGRVAAGAGRRGWRRAPVLPQPHTTGMGVAPVKSHAERSDNSGRHSQTLVSMISAVPAPRSRQ